MNDSLVGKRIYSVTGYRKLDIVSVEIVKETDAMIYLSDRFEGANYTKQINKNSNTFDLLQFSALDAMQCYCDNKERAFNIAKAEFEQAADALKGLKDIL